MKTILLFVFTLFLATGVMSQKADEKCPKDCDKECCKDKVKVEFHGFVKNDIMYDTRQNVEALDGLFIAYPKDEMLDGLGNDINEEASLNLISHATRLSTSITGPEFHGAKTTGYIEFDFTGRSNTANVRLRRAFFNLEWENTSILFGRDWHPLVVKEMIPKVANWNTGSPFNAFNRSAQLTLTHRLGAFHILASALMQNDYKSMGPDPVTGATISSPIFQRHAVMPNLHLSFRLKTDEVFAGIAGDVKRIQPRTKFTGTDGNIYTTDAKVTSYAFAAFTQIKADKIIFKAKGMIGENLTDHLLSNSGYAVKTKSEMGYEEYTPGKSSHVWANVLFGDKFKVGAFVGYSKNLGFKDEILATSADEMYGRAENIDHLFRVSPMAMYQYKKLLFWAELEHTTAAYGDIDFADKGKVINTHDVSNNRLQLTAIYFF